VAIIHGLPQTINNSDVDVDFPLDADLDDLSDSGLTLPLPGETTPVSNFIKFCHLAQLLSLVLSQLYTTTERRGGAEKIRKLNQQLESWGQTTADVQVLGEGDEPPTMAIAGNGHLPDLWLPLMFQVTKLLIHRPGLTFEPSTVQFQECLDVCTEISSRIIELCSQAVPIAIDGIIPPVHGLVFHCGLMHIYYHCTHSCHVQSVKYTKGTSTAFINQAVAFLLQVVPPRKHQSPRDILNLAIMDSVGLLQSLSRAVLQAHYNELGQVQNFGTTILDGSIIKPGILATDAELDNVVVDSALENMNQFDSLSWIFADQLSPFLNSL
jgi:hypothetical protein